MLTLAIDTSTPLGSVALSVGEGAGPCGESALPVRADHSETLLPEIDRLLRAAGRTASELSRVVIGSGPGSFTGVRIGASVAKGLCAATGAELLAYSSLAAIAAGAGCDGPVCALIDARRGQVYAATFVAGGTGLEERWPPAATTLDALLDRVRAEAGPAEAWSAAGSLSPELRSRVRSAGLRLLPPHLGTPRAASLLWLAGIAPAAGRVADVESWEPGYLRAPAAERERAR